MGELFNNVEIPDEKRAFCLLTSGTLCAYPRLYLDGHKQQITFQDQNCVPFKLKCVASMYCYPTQAGAGTC